MWVYEKKLQYPVKVTTCNPKLAKFLIEQYGGADGELAAALRYLNQRYTIPDKVIGLLTDIGTEEFAHLEMIAAMVYKQTIRILQQICQKKRG
jgi:spore coat protein JC